MYFRILAVFAGFVMIGSADTLLLRSGRSVSGSYLGGDARQIKMVVGDKVETFSIADVSRLEFGAVASTPPPAGNVLESVMNTAASQPAASSEIPAGTILTITLIDPVDSERDRVGQTYRASLGEPIIMNGEVVVPRGADVVAKLVDDKQSGKIEGKTIMTLDLQSIAVRGRVVDVDTQEVTQASGSRTKKSGLVIGGLTALGAVIGGIAGGGKGAAVGAVSGAGAGTAVQVMTKGEKIHIPSETRLTFTLQQPIRL